MPKYNVNDKFILHSSNGHDYTLQICNVNECRPPNQLYACDVYDDEGHSMDDVYFCNDDWLDNYCVKV